MHAIAALLKGSSTITEVNLRSNAISDEGARALAAVLSGRTGLRSIDLRGNTISKQVCLPTHAEYLSYLLATVDDIWV